MGGGPQEQDSLTEAQPGAPQSAGAKSRTDPGSGPCRALTSGPWEMLLPWPLRQRPELLAQLALLPIRATAGAALGRCRGQAGSRAGSRQWARQTGWVATGIRGDRPPRPAGCFCSCPGPHWPPKAFSWALPKRAARGPPSRGLCHMGQGTELGISLEVGSSSFFVHPQTVIWTSCFCALGLFLFPRNQGVGPYPWFSQLGPCDSGVDDIWELVRNTNSQTPI